jgi:hypothetical protein
MRRSLLLVLGTVAALGGVGCLADEPSSPVAGLLVTVAGSDAVHGRAPVVSSDGYELQLQRALLGFAAPFPEEDRPSPRAPGVRPGFDIGVGAAQGCSVRSELSALFGSDAERYVAAVYDLAKDEPLEPLPRWNVRPTGCPRYSLSLGNLAPDFGYYWPGQSVVVQRNPSSTPLDNPDLEGTTGSVAVRALVTGKGKRVLLDLVVDMVAAVRECGRAEGSAGIAYSEGDYAKSELIFEAERLFSDDPKVLDEVHLEELVAADADGDGVVTAAELMARPTTHPFDFEWSSEDGYLEPTTSIVGDLLEVFAYRMVYAFRDTRLGRCSVGFMPVFERRSVPSSGTGPEGEYIPPKERLALPGVRASEVPPQMLRTIRVRGSGRKP